MLLANHKKRFIAGASCPSCKQIDHVQVWAEDGVPVMHCVSCGYTEKQNHDNSSTSSEGGDVEPLRFVDQFVDASAKD
ncbi:YheV family putative zinc ribbon protein [Agaribacterium haliotis]|uniref:YheV family putative zinc ribbon protein n=1 Tax=Agaribacterium haliotis TaxID=2013869 RepID=UPI00195C423D|nr:YheV family putative zinc ribbon protein [Agaribacterium haliotis]